jgi:hypothetical protein
MSARTKPPWSSRVNGAGARQCKKPPGKPVQSDYRTPGKTGNSQTAQIPAACRHAMRRFGATDENP